MGIRVIGQKKFEVTETELLQQDLLFYLDNPRVYSVLHENGHDNPTQTEIEEIMCSLDHVKSLKSQIMQNGGLISQFTEWANEMSRQIRHRSYERSLTQSDKKFLADESVTDVDGVDISLGTELDSYDMDDSDSVANTDLLSKLSLLMDMGKKKTKYNVLNLNSKFTVDQKQTLEHVFDALYAKYTNAKANDIIQTIIDSF